MQITKNRNPDYKEGDRKILEGGGVNLPNANAALEAIDKDRIEGKLKEVMMLLKKRIENKKPDKKEKSKAVCPFCGSSSCPGAIHQ